MIFFHYIFRGFWEEHHWASDHTTEHRGLDDQPSERNFISHCVWFLPKGGLRPVQQSAGGCSGPQEWGAAVDRCAYRPWQFGTSLLTPSTWQNRDPAALAGVFLWRPSGSQQFPSPIRPFPARCIGGRGQNGSITLGKLLEPLQPPLKPEKRLCSCWLHSPNNCQEE